MFSYIVLLLSFCAFSSIRADIPYKDCGSEAGTIVSFNVSGCTALPCKFSKGNNYTMVLIFLSKAPSKTASLALHGVIGGIPVPFPISPNDVCQMGAQCPINNGDKETINFSMAVLPSYPSISLYVKLEIIANDLKQDYTCVTFPAVIVG